MSASEVVQYDRAGKLARQLEHEAMMEVVTELIDDVAKLGVPPAQPRGRVDRHVAVAAFGRQRMTIVDEELDVEVTGDVRQQIPRVVRHGGAPRGGPARHSPPFPRRRPGLLPR